MKLPLYPPTVLQSPQNPIAPLRHLGLRVSASANLPVQGSKRQRRHIAPRTRHELRPGTPSARLWSRPPGTAFSAPTEVFVLRSRLIERLDWWNSIGACRKVLRTIKTGILLDLIRSPPPFKPRDIPINPEKRLWLHQELDRAVEKGAYEPPTCLDYVAPAFIITQRNKNRIVIDFSIINQSCKKGTCRYEGLKDLQYLLKKDEYMFSLDLTDAYWHVGVHQSHRKFLTFQIDGRIFQCAALPFGWTGSPLTFTKIMRALVKHLRSHGIRCLPYLDDLAFFVSGTYQDALAARARVENILLASGLTKNPSKGQWDPSTTLHDHLGMQIDSKTGTFTAPPRRCAAAATLAKDLLCTASRYCRHVPTKILRTFAGTAVSMTLALRSARFRLRSVFDCINVDSPSSTLSRQAITDLNWWTRLSATSPDNGLPIWPPATSRTLFCDASGENGWGAQLHINAHPIHAHGYWLPGKEKEAHITFKELRAVRLSLLALLPEVQNQHILLWEDNIPVVHLIANGTSRSPELMQELRLLWAFLITHNITILPQYVKSQDNPADWWSRWEDRSAWHLQPALFDHLQALHLGTKSYTLDPFACRATALTARYCSLRPDPDALARNGFSVAWADEMLWLNPPWELIPRVLYKLRCEKAVGILIAPIWTSQTWWPSLQDVTVLRFPLPPPRRCVIPAHQGMVEPFLHPSLQLCAFVVNGSLAL